MASSARQRRKQERKAQERRRIRRAQRQLGPSPTTPVRMSDVIRHVAEPIVAELGDTIEDLEWIIRLTAAAWNLTLLAKAGQPRQFERLAEKFCGCNREAIARFRWICDVVAERKMLFYPHSTAAILDVYFTRESTDSLYFEVLHAVAPLMVVDP
jgi:hypothetical protein